MAENTSHEVLSHSPIVGLEDDALKIMERLLGKSKHLDVISIVGMPGIGKSTLALKVYNHPYVAHHFYIRAWISISQVYKIRDLLLGILRSPHVDRTERDLNQMSDEGLKEHLYKRLKEKRYLIVLDDIWDIEAWEDLKRCFPTDNNGSRIMFTTRIRDVALRANSNSLPYDMHFLSTDESWDLLQEKAFNKEICPPELMEIGKNIAKICLGLPLAIVIVGGLLAKTEKTIQWWAQVGESIASYLVSDSSEVTKTLELSYNHLPDHLKPLFLYFGAFPEDYEIPVSKLIWLWMAEGFIKKSGAGTVEGVAEGYLMDLIERSLILIANRNSIGGVKSCRIHDLLRDLCLRKAEEENFMQIISRYKHFSSIVSSSSSSSSSSTIGNKLYRLSTTSYHSFLEYFPSEQYPNIRSLLAFDQTRFLSEFDFQHFKLLRVLDFGPELFESFPSGIGRLVHLRYLALNLNSYPQSKLILRNLETLILRGEARSFSDYGIFQMTKLRHLHIEVFEPNNCDYSKFNLLVELQTMSTPTFTGINCAILRTTPNLRKLRCFCACFCPEMEFLVKLEKLHMRRDVQLLSPSKPFDLFGLPASLKQITLSEFRFDWKNISKLARLPNLEVLKLLDNAFKGKLWDTSLLESNNFQPIFPKLKFLEFKSLDIVQWNASVDHFPSLQRLVLNMCFKLKEIPSDLGDIATLETIEVNWSSHSLACSVREILEEQQDKGNEQLKIFVNPPDL